MFSAFQTFGRLGAGARAVSAAWSPLALWPDGAATPGLWISPRTVASSFADSTGTTPVAAPGTVADTSNPVGLALDIRAGATALTDPGNHMLQATSPARPLLSARRNLLTYTEDFSGAPWNATGYGGGTIAITANYAIAPDGSLTACRLQATAPSTADSGGLLRYGILSGPHIRSYWLKSNTGADQKIILRAGFANVTATPAWQRVEYQASDLDQMFDSGVYRSGGTFDSDASCDVLIWHPQFERGAEATDYQSVPGDGSTYASTGFPIAQKYDGVDDGMATAAFSAGTLTAGMDCMIVVRRDSGASLVLANYDDVNGFFGYAEAGIGFDNCFGTSAGSPTVWVDGVQLSGGTTVSADTLNTAMTVGDWRIVEFRNLDLSAWTNFSFSEYDDYIVNCARGDILLYPSTAPTADKDAARQWLADYYGVTLA